LQQTLRAREANKEKRMMDITLSSQVKVKKKFNVFFCGKVVQNNRVYKQQ
jgi:hypothetical protein